jgi:hypothetical protein
VLVKKDSGEDLIPKLIFEGLRRWPGLWGRGSKSKKHGTRAKSYAKFRKKEKAANSRETPSSKAGLEIWRGRMGEK